MWLLQIYVALTQGGVHGTDSSLLRSIARLSGGVCMPLARSAELVSISSGEHQETVLSSLKLGGLDEDALFEEALTTVPDARIVHGRWALLDSGSARVSGCIPASIGTPSDVTVEVSRGEQSTSVVLPWPASAEVTAAEQPLLGRLLSVSFAVSAVIEAESSQWDAEAATAAAEGLMRRYGVASEHTTLLLLHEAVQFVDNDLECPAAHPAYSEWQQLAAEKAARRAADEAKALARVNEKLESMMAGFVENFRSLRSWKNANEQIWGRKQPGETMARAREGVRRGMMDSIPQACMGRQALHDIDGSGDCDDIDGSERDCDDMLLCAAAPLPPVNCAPLPTAAAAPPLPAAGGPLPPAPAAGGPPRATAKNSADAVDDADDAMDDALVRASSLDSIDRQFSNCSSSASSATAAAVDGPAREAYLKPIRTALQTSVQSGYAAFLDQKAAHGSSPSFYLYSAQIFREASAPPSLCLKIATNVVEMSLCNAQTCRVVAYFVLSLGLSDLAVAAFENVITLAPEEPQSQTDLAFARFFRLRETLRTDRDRKPSAVRNATHTRVNLLTATVCNR